MTKEEIAALVSSYAARGGEINVVESGKRAVSPTIMRAAETGATLDDFRAARRGLITYATPARNAKKAKRH